jgi:hypothetical protein
MRCCNRAYSTVLDYSKHELYKDTAFVTDKVTNSIHYVDKGDEK